MSEQYRQACHYVSEYIFDNGFELNAYELQKALYYVIRDKFSLKAQMAVSVFRTVTARYKAVQEQMRQNPYKYKDKYGDLQFISQNAGMVMETHRVQTPSGRSGEQA